MFKLTPTHRLVVVSAGLAALTLGGCMSHSQGSRYGEACYEPCTLPVYVQPHMATYYRLPDPQPQPLPLPAPEPAPVVITAPPPVISCPAGTLKTSSGTCMEIAVPTYTPPPQSYPSVVIPPSVYKPVRK